MTLRLNLCMDLCLPTGFTTLLALLFATTVSISAAQFNVGIENRTLCPESEHPRPPNRVDTNPQVVALRAEMDAVVGGPLDAYLTLASDAHGSRSSEWDKRVRYISGFSGSNGYTIITKGDSALWTDGRYFLQGEQQLECSWILMKMSTAGYPTGPEWLASILAPGSRVGAHPYYVPIDTWQLYEAAFAAVNISLVPVDLDLVDKVWDDLEGQQRPTRPNNPLIVHTLEFSGKTTSDKLVDVRSKMAEVNAEALILTILEESAWLFNLRGSDITDSLFYGYAIIYLNTPSKLFINNVARALSNENITNHLQIQPDGSCTNGVPPQDCIVLHEYNTIVTEIENDQSQKIWLDPSSNYAVYAAAGPDRLFMQQSPIALMKAIKNSVERVKFFECILRDSAAVVEFAAELEESMKSGGSWTEQSAASRLYEIRSTFKNFKGISFDTISAVGENAAVIHYRPTDTTDTQLTLDKVFLLDSGGQYLDGTTDVTRTFHFGTPTDEEREAYTRVLMGAIDLAVTVWPEGTYGRDIDGRARTPLWQHGWNYNHGTGHGIGYFLSVHEGPGRINLGYDPLHAPLYEGMFFSDEPGYYEDGKFGVRLETLVGVVKANTPNQFDGKQYLTFREATLVPFEPHMIKTELLSNYQLEWLDAFHQRCAEETGQILLDRGKQGAYDWLIARTGVRYSVSVAPSTITGSTLLCLILMALASVMKY